MKRAMASPRKRSQKLMKCLPRQSLATDYPIKPLTIIWTEEKQAFTHRTASQRSITKVSKMVAVVRRGHYLIYLIISG